MKKSKLLLCVISVILVIALILPAYAAEGVPALTVKVDGTAVQWTDAVPFINSDGRTMVPLRAVGDALGLEVSWNGEAREAVFTDGSKTIYFVIYNNVARTSTGIDVEMDTAAVISNSRTYAPVRYLAEFFGYKVSWNASLRAVIIESPAEVTPPDEGSSGEDANVSAGPYTDEQLCKMAGEYYEAAYGIMPPFIDVTSVEGDIVTLHLYDIVYNHADTYEWYTIDRNTGKGHNFFGKEVDLTNPAK